MNIQLRKQHKKIWVGLGVVLTVLIGRGITAIPENPIADIPMHFCSMQTSIELCWVGNDFHEEPIEMFLSRTKSGFDIDLKQPLKSAFTLVYLSKTKGLDSGSRLVGRMDGMDYYTFDADLTNQEYAYVVLYDHLKQSTLYYHPVNSLAP